MSHIKAEVLNLCCTRNLMYPLTVKCDSQDENNRRCDRVFGDMWETNEHCEHSVWKPTFIERDYKRFTAEEHNGTWDYMFGCYDLDVAKTSYLCSYLEIDGRVYCDVRDEYCGFDPRNSSGEDTE